MGTGNKTDKSREYLNDEVELDMDCVIVESEMVMASAVLNQTKMLALTREMGGFAPYEEPLSDLSE